MTVTTKDLDQARKRLALLESLAGFEVARQRAEGELTVAKQNIMNAQRDLAAFDAPPAPAKPRTMEEILAGHTFVFTISWDTDRTFVFNVPRLRSLLDDAQRTELIARIPGGVGITLKVERDGQGLYLRHRQDTLTGLLRLDDVHVMRGFIQKYREALPQTHFHVEYGEAVRQCKAQMHTYEEMIILLKETK